MTKPPIPDTVLVAGDWHGDYRWAHTVISRLSDLTSDEPWLILQLGDFGLWPGVEGKRFLDTVSQELAVVDGQLWWIDGNHEDHSRLDHANARWPVEVADRVWWLPRGHRWRWHDRTWLAVGGATSVDRGLRREGSNWWPGEEITTGQAEAISRDGHAEVMVCHDAPSSVPLKLPPPSPQWEPELPRADAHRNRLQTIVDRVQPYYLLHGHYHVAHQTRVDLHYGSMRVTGLDREYSADNANVLDVRDMSWRTGSYAGGLDGDMRGLMTRNDATGHGSGSTVPASMGTSRQDPRTSTRRTGHGDRSRQPHSAAGRTRADYEHVVGLCAARQYGDLHAAAVVEPVRTAHEEAHADVLGLEAAGLLL